MSFIEECQSTLTRIHEDNPSVRGLRYFMNTAARWHANFDQDLATPEVVVLGNGIPEQLIYACNVAPYHLLGGSHASCQWSDDVVPRDSDPISRSILGHALRLAGRTDIDPLFVVPTSNDNMRKITYLLKREGNAVLSVDIPSVGTSATAQLCWEHAAETLVSTVGRHVGTRATARSLRRADQLVGAARAAMVNFQNTCAACEGVLGSEARLLVLNSYYMTENLAQWTAVLDQLSAEVRTRHDAMRTQGFPSPRIIAIGSPILFPQYKVPSLIHDAGLHLLATIDAASTSHYASLTARERIGGARHLVHAIARKHYSLDSSSAHVVNRAMEQYVEYLVSNMDVEGVVCHILKGQIEYDFLLGRLEPLFERYDIPVFRLETDYQYQDVEQLRIRLEAFSEMLQQRAFVVGQANAHRHCA